MPFAGFENFEDCKRHAPAHVQDKDAYCGAIKHRTEDKSMSDGRLSRALSKARAAVISLALNIWEPNSPAKTEDSIFTDETEDYPKDIGVVHGVGDIDDGGKTPDAIKKHRDKQGSTAHHHEGGPSRYLDKPVPMRGFPEGFTTEHLHQLAGEINSNVGTQLLDPRRRDDRQMLRDIMSGGAKMGRDGVHVKTRNGDEWTLSRKWRPFFASHEDSAVRKGKLTENIQEAIADIQSAAHSLSGVGDMLDNMHKAETCKTCKGVVGRGQRRMIEAMMKQRGWTPDSHKQFWGRISGGDITKGEPGGHTACVSRMEGKVDDPHAFCAWAEHTATGSWPGEKGG